VTRHHCVCGKLAPVCSDEHLDGDWFRIDLDGSHGPIPPIWIGPEHSEDSDAEIMALIHREIMLAATERFAGAAS